MEFCFAKKKFWKNIYLPKYIFLKFIGTPDLSKFERNIPDFKSSIQCLNLRIFKEFCYVYFTKLLEGDRIPTNIDINERLWVGWFGENGTSLRFIYRNRF